MKVANFHSLLCRGIACTCLLTIHLASLAQTDSTTVARWLEQAKVEMNKDAEVGLLYLDSVWQAVQQAGHNRYQLADYHKVVSPFSERAIMIHPPTITNYPELTFRKVDMSWTWLRYRSTCRSITTVWANLNRPLPVLPGP